MTRDGKIVVAIVNNMPDSGLRAAERQLCSLLASASAGMTVELKFFSPEAIPRSEVAQAHIARYYDDVHELLVRPPDGMIVTGAEPLAAVLSDEPFWPWLSKLIDWANESAVPAIWTCLAAHAAVLQMDGIERKHLQSKVSGVFDCLVASDKHAIVAQIPRRWRVPHSRIYGLSGADLVANGYSLLSQSPDIGPNLFVKQEGTLQVFLQGHPEYEATTLASEYRRDVSRFLTGQKDTYPHLPTCYWDAKTSLALLALQRRASASRTIDLMRDVDAAIAACHIAVPWSLSARQLYRNWLSYLASRKFRAGFASRKLCMAADQSVLSGQML